jgi:hypothetical protein
MIGIQFRGFAGEMQRCECNLPGRIQPYQSGKDEGNLTKVAWAKNRRCFLIVTEVLRNQLATQTLALLLEQESERSQKEVCQAQNQ